MIRLVCAVLAVASVALSEEKPSVALLRDTGGPVVEILGPEGEAPGRAALMGWSLVLAEGRPSLCAISKSEVLATWTGPRGTAVAILEVAGGGLRETWCDVVEPEWSVQAGSDFDRDGRVDLLLSRFEGEGDSRSFLFAVALRGKAGGIDRITGPTKLAGRCRGAFATSGDVDGDGAADVVFHSFEHGASYTTFLLALKGHGDGTFDPAAQKALLLESPHAASNPVLADLDGDGDLDVFLPPDDDVGDEGQGHVAFNRGDGTMENLAESLDLRPGAEGWSADNFVAMASAVDADGDGTADLVTAGYAIPEKTWELRLHRGLGAGRFDPQGTLLASGDETTSAPAHAWVRWPGLDRQAPPAPARKDMDAWWTALGGASPRDAARAMASFADAGAAAVPFLAERVPAGGALDEACILGLVRQLDDDDSEVREAATQALHGLSDVAAALLKKELAKATSPEVQVRLRDILENPPPARLSELAPADLPLLRLVAVLEAIDTPEARDAVGRLAQPNLPSAVRRAAAAAVGRQTK